MLSSSICSWKRTTVSSFKRSSLDSLTLRLHFLTLHRSVALKLPIVLNPNNVGFFQTLILSNCLSCHQNFSWRISMSNCIEHGIDVGDGCTDVACTKLQWLKKSNTSFSIAQTCWSMDGCIVGWSLIITDIWKSCQRTSLQLSSNFRFRNSERRGVHSRWWLFFLIQTSSVMGLCGVPSSNQPHHIAICSRLRNGSCCRNCHPASVVLSVSSFVIGPCLKAQTAASGSGSSWRAWCCGAFCSVMQNMMKRKPTKIVKTMTAAEGVVGSSLSHPFNWPRPKTLKSARTRCFLLKKLLESVVPSSSSWCCTCPKYASASSNDCM